MQPKQTSKMTKCAQLFIRMVHFSEVDKLEMITK